MSPTEIADRPRAAPRWRIAAVALALGLAILLLAVKSGRLQLVLGDELRNLAEKQYLRDLRVEAPRGAILDRDGRPLAMTVPASSIFAAPRDIEDPAAAAAALAPLLDFDEEKLTRRLTGKRAFVWLRRRVSPDKAREVKALGLRGIGLRAEPKRYYPGKTLAGQLLGAVSIDGEGQFGLEKRFDDHLRGTSTVVRGLRDNLHRRVLLDGGLDVDLMHGDDVTLTLDGELQHLAEELLDDALDKYNAKSAFAVVLDPRTGAIRAMANAPLYNPNVRSSGPASRNHVLSDAFEPGSTFKIISFAAALDAGVVKPEDRIFCENGRLKIGRHTIRDAHAAGWLTAAEVFSHSSNIGTIKITQRVGEERFRDVIDRFGFGGRPGLGLIGESRGRLPGRWGDVRLATVSFGHGIPVTPLPLASAVGAVATGGVYITPRLLESVKSATGEVVVSAETGEARRVISADAAETLAQIMTGVVGEGGTGRRAAIRGVSVAGKTGTAEKVDPVTGRYSRELHLSSFVGFAPAEDPRVVAVVMIDEPKGVVFGGATAGPIWREIVEAALIDEGVLDARTAEDAKAAPRAEVKRPVEADTSIVDVGVEARAAAAEGGVPEFRGLSAREALKLAGATGARVRMLGTGRVVGQEPATGTDFDSSKTIELKLEADGGRDAR
jgi:cell division protein FtsI (penicillin-binding protein 3)